jgi:trimeric autotransporter adhesin
MAQSYTRQSSMSDGDTITAALFNNEYNQLVNAFAYSSSSASSTGHRHDGTAGHGGNIHTIGDLDFLNKIVVDGTNNRWGFFVEVSSAAVEQIRIQDGAIVPVTDNDIDLGTSSLEFKDAYFDGTVTSDAFAGPLTGDVTGNVSGTAATVTTAAQSNITSLGTLTTLTVDNVIVNGTTIGHTSDTDLLTLTSGVLTVAGELDATSLDISGDADIDGTLEADAITIGGVTLAETISDTVGAMVSSNTETNITVTYEDSDNTLDFVIGTLNQDTTGLAATATALATARTIHGVSFDGTANIDLTEVVQDTVGAMVSSNTESGITVAYQDGDGTLDFTVGTLNQDTTGTAATVTTAAQPNITSLGTLTTLTVDNVIVNGTTIGHTSDTDLITLADGNVTIAGELDLTTLDVSGDADIDGTLEADAITIGGVTLAETIADTVGAMVGSNTESGITVAYQDGDNTLDFTVGTLNQDTTGTAAIATTVTITDNESTNESNAVIFTAGGDVDGGNLGLESDGNLTYNPSSGTLTATAFAGALTGNVTGNASGTAATVTTAAQSNITSLGTLTTLTVDNVIVNGTTIGHTSDTDLMTLADGVLTVAGEVDAASLDISGNVDIDGVLETDNLTIGGAQGSDGQVLTSTGSGVGWEDSGSGGASNVNGLSDAKTFGTSSIMIGDATTGTISGANYNTALGIDVFAALTTGDENVAIGFQALDSLTTGSNNVAIGSVTLGGNTTGSGNTAVGRNALDANTTADNNTAIGLDALGDNTTGSSNTALGHLALAANTTGTENTAVGKGAADATTTGSYNVAMGNDALGANTTGAENTALGYRSLVANTTGTKNVAVGSSSLDECTTGDFNTAVGTSALTSVTTSDNNTAVGYAAGQEITTGTANTAVGQGALAANTTANDNTAVGRLALNATTTGAGNTGVGGNVLLANTTGASNAALGYAALDANTTGANNVGIGYAALGANTTASGNTAIGKEALDANTTGASNTAMGISALGANIEKSYNTAVGKGALEYFGGSGASSDGWNTAVGAEAMGGSNSDDISYSNAFGGRALKAQTSSDYNNMFGYQAGTAITTGSYNSAFGHKALLANTTGQSNTVMGFETGQALTDSESNAFFGMQAGYAATTSDNNTFVGWRAGYANTTGTENDFFGKSAGSNVTTGSYNVLVGSSSSTAAATSSNAQGFGYNLTCSDNYTTIGQGAADIRAEHGVATWATVSDERVKKDIEDATVGLAFINDLRPVTFNYKNKGDLPENFRGYEEGSTEVYKNSKSQHGFIAQEVKAAIDKHSDIKDGFGMWDDNDLTGQQRVGEAAVIPVLVKAVQELSAEVEELKIKLGEK